MDFFSCLCFLRFSAWQIKKISGAVDVMISIYFKWINRPSISIFIFFILFCFYRLFLVQATLPDEGQAYLKRWIAGAYTSAAIANKPESPTSEELAAWYDTFVRDTDITFVSIKARGVMKDNIIIRADIRVKGQPPPDGKPVRYYRMNYSLLIGWCHSRQTSAIFYYILPF